MKKYVTKIIAVSLTLLLVFFGGRGMLEIAANPQADKNVNYHLLGSSAKADSNSDSGADKDINYHLLGNSSGVDTGPEIPDGGIDVALGASQLTLGYSMSTFGAFDVNSSISGAFPAIRNSQIVIVPGTDGLEYQAYDSTALGLREALMNLYTNGNNRDFAIHIGSTITIPSDMCKEIPSANITEGTVSFSALKGKVGTLVLLANYDDPVDHESTTAITTTIGTINFPDSTYFGSNIIMRNISYKCKDVYMLGHSLTLGYGSYFTALTPQFFGGTNSGTAVTGNPTMTIYSTGSGLQSFYGGGRTPISSVIGNTSVVVYNTSITPILALAGGGLNGTISGNSSLIIHNTSASNIGAVNGGTTNGKVQNTSLTIHNTGSPIDALYGGTGDGTVYGSVTNTINNTGGTIGSFFGGAYFGTIHGDVNTVIHNMGGSGDMVMHAGGFGAQTGYEPTLNGNVSTTINNLGNVRLKEYYGGTMYGNVAGSITNVLRGTGRFNRATLVRDPNSGSFVYSGGSTYIGGSYKGNVGTSLSVGSLAVNNDIDTSGYTDGTVHFCGGNGISGTTMGSIKNKATASDVFNTGSISSFAGGSGQISLGAGISDGASFYDSYTSETASTHYSTTRANTLIKTYGNIDNILTKGVMSDDTEVGFTRGAGFAGYVEGNVTTTVGTQGKVSSASGIGISNTESNTINNRGIQTNYYIVGGGGNIVGANAIFVKGNIILDMQNVLARWVYGGNLSGLIYGNSTAKLSGGVVDSLMGGGVANHQQWGSANAVITGGQVDWFTCGGGFNDRYINGSVSVTITGGTINASVGGTYGMTPQHVIKDHSTVLVTGGDFSGKPNDGDNGFSGGATNVGVIEGNSTVTLDFRNSATPFVLPKGTYITGGRRYNALEGSYLGTVNNNNTIELNIFTDPGSDVLNGASIYGDGSTFPYSTQSTTITVNIDAPDSSVGIFYATQYTNISRPSLLRDVTFNIYNLRSIQGISGGSDTDNFTNADVAKSLKKATINVNPKALDGDPTKMVTVGAVGIVNFTDFNITNAIMDVAGTVGIKNGSFANGTNHGTSYHQFGNINVTKGGGFKVGPNAIISGNMLTIDGKAELTSPSGSGKFIVSDITIGADDSIYWTRSGGSMLESVTGTWYGQNQAYKVITFNPVPSNALKVTPYNFTGVDDDGKIYLGDNDVTSNPFNGHAVAIPGTRIDFEVVGGAGTISHNVRNVLQTDPPPHNGSASVGKDIQTTSGWIIVSDTFVGTKLTFTPESVVSGSWLKGVEITRSDNLIISIPEAAHSDPVEWVVPEKGYSYVVKVTYTNLAELSGRSVMISELEASLIATAEDIMGYQDISGRPHLASDINPTLIANINEPLPTGMKVRSHKITYTVGTSGNMDTKFFYIGVVPNRAVIEKPDRRAAIDANDATMMLAVANRMTESDLATNYTHPMAYLPDGTTVDPTLDSSTIVTLNTMITPTAVNATYSYALTSPVASLQKEVIVLVIPDGKLALDTVPVLGFGQTKIPASKSNYWKPTSTTLIVEDSRIAPFGSTWEVTLWVTDLKAGTETISAADLLYANNTALNGPTGVFPLDTVTTVWESATDLNDTQALVWPTSTVEGFSIQLDPTFVKVGAYEGVATWSLQATPTTP